MYSLREQWFGNVRADVLAGLVVALALIPEAIAFSILAGVDPMVGLYASFVIAVTISFVGGRPAMISAATGAMAIVIVTLVKDHGLQYLLAATVLTGLIQILFGVFKIARLMKFIPNAVMIGFVNSLAILVFIAQTPHFIGGSLMTWLFLLLTIVLIYAIPYVIKGIPAPLIAVVILSIVAVYSGINLKTVGDMGTISQSLPSFLIPDIPWTFETLMIILPYSLALAVVGLVESLLTASILDDMTTSDSDKNKEARGQGIANVINGFFGGMAGCAMIGQSVINVKSGGRGRLSTFVAGAFLMFLILVLGDFVVQIPMPVLAGVMIVVCITQFDWHSFKYAVTAPKKDVFVMLLTIVVVLYTHNLAIGVVAGIVVSALFFVNEISRVKVTQNGATFNVTGQLFFASTESFVNYFKSQTINETSIIINFENAKVWDDSAVGSLLKVKDLLKAKGITITYKGIDESGKQLMRKLTGNTMID
ncbi:sulfate permease [Lysinibacillus sp. 2017]|uniref:SulP family inorganic anion transporter n=1 Tax=unclassified Lysinibacillus TaxID=2636778 RepID=UPI000D526BB7|nr:MULTISPECIES: SulP family inorganic anion transporter [unclassified Lysinibacillus]AWE07561.1 sulfate permease [Lysinibacillus sp. 2017]TGN36724.1 SulP family inorganic anion transporter [Lysinibacillus sp. S2017]